MRGRLSRTAVMRVRLNCDARNKNATEINGKKLKDGDMQTLRHGDVIRMNETPLTYIGTPIDDKTVTT